MCSSFQRMECRIFRFLNFSFFRIFSENLNSFYLKKKKKRFKWIVLERESYNLRANDFFLGEIVEDVWRSIHQSIGIIPEIKISRINKLFIARKIRKTRIYIKFHRSWNIYHIFYIYIFLILLPYLKYLIYYNSSTSSRCIYITSLTFQ